MRRIGHGGALQQELENRIKNGRCVYCRAHAAPDRPLTREHVIPRARGGSRKDARIIVPACARCNHRRGCQEIVLFLLARPRRIVAFLDYLSTLPPETVRQLDVRVFAELYAAVRLLEECATSGEGWRRQLRRLSAGRRLHRRRYAARRIVTAVGVRIERSRGRDRAEEAPAPTCLVPGALAVPAGSAHSATLARGLATLLGTLAVLWEVPAERVLEEMERESRRAGRANGRGRGSPQGGDGGEDDEVLPLDGWRPGAGPRGRRRRVRVEGRGGQPARLPRGRAA